MWIGSIKQNIHYYTSYSDKSWTFSNKLNDSRIGY